MLYLETGNTDPHYNLAFEEYFFSIHPLDEDCCILWQNDRSVIIGKYQNTAEEIDPIYVREHGISVVRRNTGGGAVYHDLGNLNYSFIVDGTGQNLDFGRFAIPMVRALERLGIHAEFTGRNDLTVDGRKFSGTAQCIRGGKLLHHGTLLLSSDLEAVQSALHVSADKLESKSIKSVRSRVANLSDYLPHPLSVEEWKAVLCEELFRDGSKQIYTPKEHERAAISDLCESKYRTWEWNYGRNPQYHIEKSRRLEGVGRITVHMNVEDGTITALAFFGDFFSSIDPDTLAQHLIGCRLTPECLQDRLCNENINHYFLNMTVPQFLDLMLL